MDVSPWRTGPGRLARHNQMVLLARGEGDLADFARDVLAGRAKPEDLLYRSYLSEKTVDAAHEEVDGWLALPEAEQEAAVAAAEAGTRAEIAALAALDLSEPAPVAEDDDYDFGGGVMKTGW
jgi:hypothetical protein